jgi:hypothetical protein
VRSATASIDDLFTRREVTVIASYTAYFAESGTHGGSTALVVSGWVADDEQWRVFESEWMRLLADFAISMFHMRDFNHGRREFELRKGDRLLQNAFCKRAIQVVRSHVRHGFAAAVILEDYRKINEKYLLREFLGRPYSLAALACVNKGNQWVMRRGYTDPVHNVFEDGAEGKGEFLSAVRMFDQRDPSFRTKKDCTPFQIADLAAYELYKKRTDLKEGEMRSRRSFEGLISIPNSWEVFEQTSLERYCQTNKVPLRNDI